MAMTTAVSVADIVSVSVPQAKLGDKAPFERHVVEVEARGVVAKGLEGLVVVECAAAVDKPDRRLHVWEPGGEKARQHAASDVPGIAPGGERNQACLEP
jgi:hypothetical protein